MNKTEPKKQESYESPEVRDIAPVSIAVAGSDSTQDIDDQPGFENPNNWD